ncbi:MAG: hypothetical protein MZU97_07135 [Bacillus subtilis]|nr:hypothetical protein [Bacillus subtilis]
MSHGCGPNERHLPVDGSRVCALCVYAFSMVATSVANPAASELPAARASLAFQVVQRPTFSDLFHSGKRGPPTA